MNAPGIRLLTGSDIQIEPGFNTISGPYPAALFIALALTPGKPLSREFLSTLLWPEAEATSSRQRLRMALLKLRSQLNAETEARLATTKDVIQLDIQEDSVDLHQFETLARSQHPSDRLRAIELYEGDLVERFPEISDTFDEQLRNRRALARNTFLSICHQVLSDPSSVPAINDFEAVLQRALKIDPTNSDIVRSALVFFGREGSVQRVNEIFDRYENALRTDLDIAPEEAIRQLRDRMRSQAEKTAERMVQDEESVASRPPVQIAGAALGNGYALRKRRHFIAAATAFAGVILVATSGFFLGWFSENQTAVLLLKPLGANTQQCWESPNSRFFESASQTALLAIPNAVVIISPLQEPARDGEKMIFLVERRVICEAATARASLTLARESTGEILLIQRYDLSQEGNSDLATRMTAEIRQALSR